MTKRIRNTSYYSKRAIKAAVKLNKVAIKLAKLEARLRLASKNRNTTQVSKLEDKIIDIYATIKYSTLLY